jgi:hypothetical protein
MGGTTSLVFNFLRGRDTVSPHMNKIGNRAQAMAARMRSSGRMMSVIIGALIFLIGGLIAEVVAFTSASAPMVGALGALPAVAFAAAAGLAALLVGFHGLGAALKKYSSGAGKSAEATAAAEHRLITAQRAALQAQLDLNEARKTAAERLADVTRQLARTRLDERAAILAVKDAQLELRSARSGGDRQAAQRAQIGYEEAVLSLEEIRARLADVTDEEAKRRTAGVEGSEEVKTALERQADAVYELAQAQRALTSGSGGANKAAEAYAKLTAQGKALVDTLHALGPAWRQVQQATQAALLGGVADDLRRISTVYLPVMSVQLPALASGWNAMFRSMSGTASGVGFVADMNLSLAQSASLWQRVGNAFGPFLSGFRHWVVIGSAFMPRMGSWVGKQAAAWDAWSAKMRQTGKGAAWIEKALVAGHDFWVLLKNLSMATVALFSAGSAGPDFLRRLSDGAASMRDFLNTDAGKAKAAALFKSLRDIWSSAWVAFKALLDLLAGADLSGVVGVFAVAGAAFGFLAQHMGLVNALLPILIPAFVAMKFALLGTRVALMAVTAATTVWKVAVGIATAVQWLWNVALTANPIGLIILAIAAFIAVIILAIKYHKQIGHFFAFIWGKIWDALKIFWAWLKDVFGPALLESLLGPFKLALAGISWVWDQIVAGAKGAFDWVTGILSKIGDYLGSLPARWKAIGAHLWDWLKDTLKDSLNWVVSKINWLIGKFNWLTGQWSKLGSAIGLSIPTFALPEIPMLASGGDIRSTGLALVHAGERVTPAAQVASLPAGGRRDVVVLKGGDALTKVFLEMIRKATRDRGGDVQFVIGRG